MSILDLSGAVGGVGRKPDGFVRFPRVRMGLPEGEEAGRRPFKGQGLVVCPIEGEVRIEERRLVSEVVVLVCRDPLEHLLGVADSALAPRGAGEISERLAPRIGLRRVLGGCPEQRQGFGPLPELKQRFGPEQLQMSALRPAGIQVESEGRLVRGQSRSARRSNRVARWIQSDAVAWAPSAASSACAAG